MKILGVIPARYASTRFPGKPLVLIGDKSMIRRVHEQAAKSELLTRVVIATDHEAIFSHVRDFGGEIMMTRPQHASGTERCHEVVSRLAENGESYDYVVNIQGDEPFLNPGQIDQLVQGLMAHKPPIATLIKKIGEADDLANPNVVKVIVDFQGFALAFSRSPIPFARGFAPTEWLTVADYYKHIGIYGYRVSILGEIVGLPPSMLERTESLEQLRWIENGFRIQTYMTEYDGVAIDTPDDLLKITNTQ